MTNSSLYSTTLVVLDVRAHADFIQADGGSQRPPVSSTSLPEPFSVVLANLYSRNKRLRSGVYVEHPLLNCKDQWQVF